MFCRKAEVEGLEEGPGISAEEQVLHIGVVGKPLAREDTELALWCQPGCQPIKLNFQPDHNICVSFLRIPYIGKNQFYQCQSERISFYRRAKFTSVKVPPE